MPRALVTGSSGFIGRHISAELKARGYEVCGWDVTEFGGDALKIFGINGGDSIFDLVVHCAYNVGGRAAIDGVNTNFAKNLQLDASMFEWAVRTKQKRVLYFSSSAAYPVALQGTHGHKLIEDDIDLSRVTLGAPDANYGWAKLTGERLAEDARKNGLAVTVCRPFSGYGEDQSRDYPFPSIVQRASSGDLSVWGPQGQTRDWIHVSDVIKGSLAVAESGTALPVNLCTGRGVEMGELARMIHAQVNSWGNSPSVASYDESKPTGVFYRVGDPTRLHEYYTPKVTLEQGIQRALKA